VNAEPKRREETRFAPGAHEGGFCTRCSLFTALRSRSAFTLIELVVAVGLMAIFMTMLATLFVQASSAFSIARASVEIHQNARAAFDVMVRDFAAAQLCSYEDKTGYFAVGWAEDPEWASAVPAVTDTAVPCITFTTLAEQPGAKPLVPGVSSQVALVRYTLRFNGGAVQLPDPSDPEKTVERPTFNLIKQVRFPQLAYLFVDTDSFPMPSEPDDVKAALIPDETCTTDILAIGVVEMRVRVFYAGDYIEVLDHGRATRDSVNWNELLRLADGSDKNWPQLPANTDVRILGGYGARALRDIVSNTNTDIVAAADPPYSETDGDADGSPDGLPAWLEPPARKDEVAPGATYGDSKMYPMIVIERVTHGGAEEMNIRMPYLVEVTLRLADQRTGTGKDFTFTERFHIRSSTE